MLRGIRRESVSLISVLPVKAFWQPTKFSKFSVVSCKSCQPYILIDKVFGEWTCRICSRQEYGETPMKKHVLNKHERPAHTCGKADEIIQDEVFEEANNESENNNKSENDKLTQVFGFEDGNNRDSNVSGLEGVEFEPMETESVDSTAETEWEGDDEVEGMDLKQINHPNTTSLKGTTNHSEKELHPKETAMKNLESPTTRLGEEIVKLNDSFKCLDAVLGEYACNICKYTSFQKWQILQHVNKKHGVQTTPKIERARKTIKKYQTQAGTEKEKK